jgi:2-phospho-L-lactate guanylyltransferase (CobY/MobA/RfbA family)|tara:strand:- start:107 stop:316 length:210 start_codon:yes stop_codon:yes gene_type:complete
LNDNYQDRVIVAEKRLSGFGGTAILIYELIGNNLRFNMTSFFKLNKNHAKQNATALVVRINLSLTRHYN